MSLHLYHHQPSLIFYSIRLVFLIIFELIYLYWHSNWSNFIFTASVYYGTTVPKKKKLIAFSCTVCLSISYPSSTYLSQILQWFCIVFQSNLMYLSPYFVSSRYFYFIFISNRLCIFLKSSFIPLSLFTQLTSNKTHFK